MKSQMVFLQKLLQDVGSRCHTSTQRDFEQIALRYEHEGWSFLGITLPDFANDFHKALDQGHVDHSMFAGFSKRGQLPKFLGGLFDLVFDRGSGRLLDDASVDAIQSIRQVTMAFGKIELECSDERIQASYDAYIQCELDLRAGDFASSSRIFLDFQRVAHLLWRSLNSRLDRRIYDGELIPAHGPGATADGLKGNQKFTNNEWTLRMEPLFPYMEYGVPVYSLYEHVQEHVDFREPGRERPVKVTGVPKTLKTLRIIAEEPTCMMFMQQALMEVMKEEIRADLFARNFICFDSQVPNQLLAKEGSATGRLATLDLKEASDRVSNQLVRGMFSRWPHFDEATQVVRSTKADVNGQIIRLAKYASMGSALTFPLEAMVFTTMVFLGIEKELNRPLTHDDIKSFIGSVRVYGDDIIVPVEYVSSVILTIERLGALVNRKKSFWNGKFRESCGADFYAGTSVDVVRVRRVFPESLRDGKEVESIVSLRNQLFELGSYTRTVDWLDTYIQRILPYYPVVTKDSGLLGKWCFSDDFTVDEIHEDEQRPLVRACYSAPRLPKNSIDGYPALLKVFLKRGQTPFEDPDHLNRSGRPRVVDIKHGLVRAGGYSGFGPKEPTYQK